MPVCEPGGHQVRRKILVPTERSLVGKLFKEVQGGEKNSNVKGGEALGCLRGTISTLFGWNKGVMRNKDGSKGGILGL